MNVDNPIISNHVTIDFGLLASQHPYIMKMISRYARNPAATIKEITEVADSQTGRVVLRKKLMEPVALMLENKEGHNHCYLNPHEEAESNTIKRGAEVGDIEMN